MCNFSGYCGPNNFLAVHMTLFCNCHVFARTNDQYTKHQHTQPTWQKPAGSGHVADREAAVLVAFSMWASILGKSEGIRGRVLAVVETVPSKFSRRRRRTGRRSRVVERGVEARAEWPPFVLGAEDDGITMSGRML